jgi:hypothetical protein
MAVIQVRTPSGIEKVRIKGDTPTAEEEQAIMNQFFSAPQTTQTSPTVPDLDLATASVEQIDQYKAALEQAGISTQTGQPFKQGEFRSLKDPDVDYTSGLKDFGLRTKLGTFELPEEKAAFLTDKIGKDGFRQDQGGRFIITKEGRKKLGIGEGPEVAIDEEGFSRYDLADFAGEGGYSLATGIGAGILLSGVGTLTAALGVGATMGLTKLIDEAAEEAAGFQRQTKEQQYKDALFEGALGFAGEGVGRAISGLFGRIIKGGGAGPDAELARAQGRALREQKFQPLFEGAAPGVRPILNRIQAVAEGVFPNRAAANKNIDIIIDDLAKYNVDSATLDALEQTMKSEIKGLYTTTGQKIANAQKVLNTEIETRIRNIMAPLVKTGSLSKDAIKALVEAKEIFTRESDGLFTAASNALGDKNEIIPIYNIDQVLKTIQARSPVVDQIKESRLYKIIEDAKDKTKTRLASEKPIPPDSATYPGGARDPSYLRDLRQYRTELAEWNKKVVRLTNITPEQAQFFRQTLKSMEYAPEWKSTLGGLNVKSFKDAIDKSFIEGEERLSLALNYFDRMDLNNPVTLDQFKSFLYTNNLNFEGEITKEFVENIRQGFNLLGRSRKFYAEGSNRLNDPIVEQLFQKTKGGKIQIDTDAFFDDIVKNNSPKQLKRFLKAIRSVPTITGLETGEATLKKQKVFFAGRELDLDEAKRVFDQLPESSTKREFGKRIDELERTETEIGARVSRGAEAAELARQQLASTFLNRVLRDPSNFSSKNGIRVLDGIKIAKQFDDLGTTKKVLFKNELDDINNLVKVLRQTGAEFDEDIVNQLSGDSIIDAVKNLSTQVANRKAFDSNRIIQSLNENDAEGIVSTLFQRGNAARIRDFNNGTLRIGDRSLSDFGNFSGDVIEKVKDASMARILRSLGDVESPKFRDDFLSGNIGRNLRSTLDSYGEETITAMFGKQESKKLFQLADNMIAVSNASIAGKGGLAAPNIALGLGLFSIIASPLGVLPTAAGYLAFSKLMRQGWVLDIMLASRKPGADKLGQAVQSMQTTISKVQAEAGLGGTEAAEEGMRPKIRPSSEGPFKLPPEVTENIKSNVQNLSSQVTAPSPASSASSVSPFSVNPSVNPNPASLALAQYLQQRQARSQ